MCPSYETILVDNKKPHLLEVTLHRPDQRNALNTQMGRELRDLFRPLVFDSKNIRCITITGAGDKAFCAGGDLRERNGMSDADWFAQHAIFEDALYAIMECCVPTIAAVNGVAYGGGFEIALACDFIYASDSATFAFPEGSLGIMPGGGGTQNLPRAVGTRRALEIIMVGKSFSSLEARDWGMINKVCPSLSLNSAVLETAEKICSNAPIAVRQAKRSVLSGVQMDLHSALQFEVQSYNRLVSTEDRREGVRAFNERRKPNFRGR